MLSRFFIDRPIFACVLAIIIMAVGLFSVLNLPVERYPDIAPPRITVSASYSGADAQAVEDSVTQVLEQQIKELIIYCILVPVVMPMVAVASACILRKGQILMKHRFRCKMP
jgi:hypothetical protein